MLSRKKPIFFYLKNLKYTVFSCFIIYWIFSYLLFCISECGYSNALSFKTIDDKDISYVQEHIKKKSEIVNNDKQSRTNIFGRSFASSPRHFQFHLGDIKLIKMLVEHVQRIVDENGVNSNLHRFKLIQKNHSDDIETKLSNILAKTNLNSDGTKDGTLTHYFLRKLLAAADKNSKRKKGGYRYEDDIKLFSAYFRMLVGPLAYETLHRNLECALPALPSVNRYIRASNCDIKEAILRCHELKIYLTNHGLPLCVILSEDETRTIVKVQHDSRSNQLVGFVLPLSKNGMPIPFQYPARDASEIINHFCGKNNISSFLNVIMAQPINPNIPAFCLLAYGSNSKYTAQDVANRWKFIVNELQKFGIVVLSVSSDSAPKYNAAMRDLSMLGSSSSQFPEWFACGEICSIPFYIQDMTHIATKLRNLILRTFLDKKLLPFGSYYIRLQHFYDLICKVSKDKHLLTLSTFDRNDRQNFGSVLKMCDPRVFKCLKDCVPGSEATIQFLQILRDIIDSYMQRDLSPIQRIRKIWYALFLIRIWRQFIVASKIFKLNDHFLTANCYTCIELNAHNLVLCILYLRTINKPEWFLPYLYESQPCEAIFRQFRASSSVSSTVVNCTIKEAISRISNIHFQNKIMLKTSSQFKYPRLKKDTGKNNSFLSLPSKEEVIHEIEFCQRVAIATATKFGLISKTQSKQRNYVCNIKPYKSKKTKKTHIEQEAESPIKYTRQFQAKDLKNIQLKDWTGQIKQSSIDKSSLYAEVTCSGGKQILVKKSSLCWLLNPDKNKLSSDRLLRVRSSPTGSKKTSNRNQKQKQNQNPKQKQRQRKVITKSLGQPYIPRTQKRRK